ncbi:hypothetical protein PFISCL1PPCAC_3691, partial [Pristionchus fissidentatus]
IMQSAFVALLLVSVAFACAPNTPGAPGGGAPGARPTPAPAPAPTPAPVTMCTALAAATATTGALAGCVPADTMPSATGVTCANGQLSVMVVDVAADTETTRVTPLTNLQCMNGNFVDAGNGNLMIPQTNVLCCV